MGDHDMLITREHAIACATNVARSQGYAIGVHGSQFRDLDLIAAPWIEDLRWGFDTWYIDLSVMPRRRRRKQ